MCRHDRRGHGVGMKRLQAFIAPVASISDVITITLAAASLATWMLGSAPVESQRVLGGAPYELMEGSGLPSAWDCDQPIRVAVNVNALTDEDRLEVLAAMNTALEQISTRTPFRFVVVGDTAHVPTSRWGEEWLSDPTLPPVLVYVGAPSQSDLWIDGAVAVGGHVSVPHSDRVRRSVAGFVVVDEEQFLKDRSPSGRFLRTAVFTHEFLHVLGLDHTRHPSSVMAPSLGESIVVLGRGDVAGLQRLAELGCG
jgi:hypothetical protein